MPNEAPPRWQITLLLLLLAVTLAALAGSDLAGDALGFCLAALLVIVVVPELRRRDRAGAAVVVAVAAVLIVAATIGGIVSR